MSPNARETLELRGIAVSKSASGFDVELPRSLKAEIEDVRSELVAGKIPIGTSVT